MNLLPKQAKYRVDMPYHETPTALHIKGIGVLEKLPKTPTEYAHPPDALYEAMADYIDCAAGARAIRGFGTIAACLVLVVLTICVEASIALFSLAATSENGYTFFLASLLVYPLLALMLYQAIALEAAPFRDLFYRISRRTGYLYELMPDRVWRAKFDDLVPLHQRVGSTAGVNGHFFMADLDRERQVVRRLYLLAPGVLSSSRGSQIQYEYLRRYMAGEFNRMPVIQRAPQPVRGFVDIARGFAPARWGLAVRYRWGQRAVPLQVLVTTVAGLLLGLPWAFATLADMRLPLPKWSDLDEAERRDPTVVQDVELPHPLIKDDPRAEEKQRPASWEARFYAVVMAVGSALWIYGLSIPIRMVLAW